jgi:hypothetical protein
MTWSVRSNRVIACSTGPQVLGLVGWSDVAEHATVISNYSWMPRHGEERITTGWQAVLGPLNTFPEPITPAQLRPLLDEIVAVDQELGARHKGTIYFPFTRYGKERPAKDQELRAVQAYFVKFPAELFDVVPGIGAAQLEPQTVDVMEVPEDYQPGKKAPAGRTTRAQDPKLRQAIERRSLDVAKAYYVDDQAGTDYEEVGKPYDIRVTVQGVARRCEVKGSSMEIDTVELTINEVVHGTTFDPLDLIVVDKIVPTRDPESGEVIGATGGRRRVWTDWTPAQSDLKPTAYAYALPPGAAS